MELSELHWAINQVRSFPMDSEYWYVDHVSALLADRERLRELAASLIPDKEAHSRCALDECAYRRALDFLASTEQVLADPVETR